LRVFTKKVAYFRLKLLLFLQKVPISGKSCGFLQKSSLFQAKVAAFLQKSSLFQAGGFHKVPTFLQKVPISGRRLS
jgi:hypothetical protein